MKVARIFLESNDDGIVMTSSYADPRGGVWWWGDNDWDRSVRNVEVCHSYINSGGGKAIALIPWGSTNPDQQKQETDNVNVYDNVLMGGYSVGTWCDNPVRRQAFRQHGGERLRPGQELPYREQRVPEPVRPAEHQADQLYHRLRAAQQRDVP